MGYSGKLEEKLLVQKLRKEGLSYKEIMQHVSVVKDTVSRWCRDIPLTEQQIQRLIKNKELGLRKGSLIAAENKRRKRVETTEKITQEALREIGKLTERDKFITGISLYAAEGNKADNNSGFSNSDPKLIKFMTNWFLEFAKVPKSKLRGAIWLHEGLNENNAKNFWSKLTGIPINQFHKTYIAKNKIDSKKIRKNIHNFGVFSIRFSDIAIHRKIMGWIAGVFEGKLI